MPRREDARLLTGRGRFVDDEAPGRAARAAVFRSPAAHGRIAALDLAAARAAPGVLAVYTQADLDAAGIGPLACRTPTTGSDGRPAIEPERPVLARDEVKYAGQPVAFVVAETEAAALDGIDAIGLDIEERPVVVGTDAALAPGAPAVWPRQAPDNVALRWECGDGAAVDAAIARAARVARLTVRHPRLLVAPVEPRGAVGEYDAAAGRYTLTAPSQGAVLLRAALAEALGCGEERLRVRTGDVGGSFAVKIWPYPEHVLCLFAARALGRPVKWTASRIESAVADAQGRGRTDRATLALDADGRVLAFRIEAEGDLGAFLHTAAPSIFADGARRALGHAYRIPALHYRVRAAFTNAPPTDAYRGAGKPESVATLERALDAAAREHGLDRIELRRRNAIRPEDLPYRTAVGETVDSGDFPGILDKALAAADWDGFAAREARSRAAGLLRGRAAGLYFHATGGSTAEVVQLRALPDGKVRLRTSAQDSGQGHRDALARIAGEALGLAPERIVVEAGDSDALFAGGSTGGSSLLPVSAVAARRAAGALVGRARDLAADALEAAVRDIEYEAGALRVAGTDRTVSLAELAARTADAPDAPAGTGEPAGCVGEAGFAGTHTTFPNGACAVEAEVDPETGRASLARIVAVDDLGRVVHEESARGQVMGGLAQAAGEALMEEAVLDPGGQPVSASLLDYALPRADDLPPFDLGWAPTASPNTPLGAKGVGELSAIGGPGPIANAVLDALAPLGIAHLDMPLGPQKIWRAIRDASAREEGGSPR